MKKLLLLLFVVYVPLGLTAQSVKADWFVFNILNSGMKSNHVNMVAMDKGGSIWVGATSQDGGLVQFDGKDWTIYSMSNSPIPDNRVNTIAVDGTGMKWIGTDGGIASLNDADWTVYHAANSGLPTNTIRCLVIDNNGDKWMGTAAGLVRLSGTTWSTFNTRNSALPHNTIEAIAVDENNGLWIGTSRGLVRYEQGKNAIDSKNWSLLNKKNSGLPSDAVSCISIDFNQNVWVGTKDKGVGMYDGNEWKVFNKNSGLPGNAVTAMVPDDRGDVWLGTSGGLALYNPDGTWKLFQSQSSDLSNDEITNLVVDIKGNKWIGTDNGLSVYKDGGLAFSTYTAKHLFKSDEIARNLNESGESYETLFRGSGDPLKGLNVATAVKEMEVGSYYALIIGIDDYKGVWSPLRNAVNDANAVEKLLKSKYKFDVFHTLTNEEATRVAIIRELEWLVDNVKEQDNVFVYYSGHGEFKQSLNKGYWVPADATTASTSRYVSNSDLKSFLGGIKSKHTLLVADACFSGDIFRGSTIAVPFENSERYYKKNHALISRQALTSGGVEPVMDGGRDGHSVFAYYFLKALTENQSQFYDASELYNNLRIPVINNSVQSPNFKPIYDTGDEGGQFIFMQK